MLAKRGVDVICSIAGLVVLAPVLLLIGLAVWLTSGAPVLFRQIRVGRGGRDFHICKFRTMSPSSHCERAFMPGDGSRITPIGRLLRRAKLDELPQLWNVLLGEMSLVGPRPEVPGWVHPYRDRWMRILQMRPGITDPAAIVFHDEEELLAASDDPNATYQDEVLPRKLALYEEYVEDWTLLGDLAVIARTVLTVAGVRTRTRRALC